jgi:hypothetical protein
MPRWLLFLPLALAHAQIIIITTTEEGGGGTSEDDPNAPPVQPGDVYYELNPYSDTKEAPFEGLSLCFRLQR